MKKRIASWLRKLADKLDQPKVVIAGGGGPEPEGPK